jgi:hypothetical protein
MILTMRDHCDLELHIGGTNAKDMLRRLSLDAELPHGRLYFLPIQQFKLGSPHQLKSVGVGGTPRPRGDKLSLSS